MDRRSFLHAASAVAVAGCAAPGGTPGVSAPASVYRVGDRWVYRAKDGYRDPVVWDETLGKADPLQRTVIVGGWEPVATPAGSFDALSMRVYRQINLNDPFNCPTQCNYEIWWAPAAGATVRETTYATYRQRGDVRAGVEFRSQNTVLEFASYRRAAA
jgi:hypothetical protein